MTISTLTGRAIALCRAVLPNNIVARPFVSETVLLDVNTGRYFRLDNNAGAMLDALITGSTVAAAARALAEKGWGLAEEVVADLEALCVELEGMGLLKLEAAA